MSENSFKKDFFVGEVFEKKTVKPSLVNKYSGQRFLPYVRIPVEYTVILAIGILVLTLIAYAVGVETGKRAVNKGPQEIFETKDYTSGSESLAEIGNVEPRGAEEIDPGEEVFTALEAEEVTDRGLPEEVIAKEDVSDVPVISVYIVQLASFKNEASAKDEVDKLSAAGKDAEIMKAGDWYQVYAAGYQTIKEAREAKSKFDEEYVDCYIRKVK